MSTWRALPRAAKSRVGEYVDPHRAAAGEYVAQALRDVLADPIAHGDVLLHGSVMSPGVLAAESHLGGRHVQPLRLPLHATPRELAVYHDPRRRREVADAWAAYVLRMHARAAGYLARLHEVMDQIMGIIPVYDAQGVELVDTVYTDPAWTERRRLYQEDLCDLLGVVSQRGEVPRLDPALRAALLRTTTAWDAPTDAISTDVVTARAQLIDRLDVAAAARRRYLLDSDVEEAIAANAVQATALRLLESRRQEGRRSLRAQTTVTALTTAADAALTRLRTVIVEDAPVWQTSAGAPISGRALSLSYTAPTTGHWTHALRAANPGVGADKTAGDLGAVVLDDADTPAGWTVTSTPRAAPASHERDVTIAWSGTGEPDAGTYSLDLTARNACGPATLTVTVAVPVPAAE